MPKAHVPFVVLLFGLAILGRAGAADEMASDARLGRADTDRWLFHAYTVADGLADDAITVLFQDDSGFLWIGTENGLHRFDGRRFRVFQADPADPYSLGADHIRAVTIAAGDLWVGTDAGLVRFDRRSETFQSRSFGVWTLGATPPVVALAEMPSGKEGRLYVGTPIGLGVIDPRAEDEEERQVVRGVDLEAPEEEPIEILALLADPTGLWVGTSVGLWRLDLDGRPVERYRADPEVTTSLPGDRVTALHRIVDEEDEAVLWVGTDAGLARLERERSGEFRRVSRSDVLALGDRGRGEVWVAARDGLFRVDEIARLQPVFGDPVGVTFAPRPEHRITALLRDHAGLVWVGTTAGLAMHDPWSRAFRAVPRRGSSDAEAEISAMAPSRTGRPWVGFEDGGLGRLDPETGAIERAAAVAPGAVLALYEEPGGTLFVGTRDAGLHLLGLDGSLALWAPAARLATASISALVRDAEGSLVIGTAGDGVWRLDAEGATAPIPVEAAAGRARSSSRESRPRTHLERFEEFARDLFERWLLEEGPAAATRGAPTRERPMRITALVRAADGGLWMGSAEAGLWYHESGGESWHRVRAPTGQRAWRVHCLVIDRAGELWVGTDDGLVAFDAARRAPRVLPESMRLANHRVVSIEEDPRGRLWVATRNGLFQVPADRQRAVAVGDRDTRHLRVFRPGASVKTESWLWFEARGGRLGIDARRETLCPTVPMLAVIGAAGDDESRSRGASADVARSLPGRPISRQDRVVVARGSAPIFELSALHFADPEANLYSYRFLGPGLEIEGDAPLVALPPLGPGDYDLIVRAANGDGVWSSPQRLLRLEVLPSPWTHRVTLVLFALASLILGAMLVQRVRGALERREELGRRLQALEAQKLESLSTLAGGIAHDFNNLLVGVLGHAELARLGESGGDKAELREHLDAIERSAERAADLAKQMLFYAGRGHFVSGRVDLSALTEEVAEMVRPTLAAETRLLLELDPRLPAIDGDEAQLRHLVLNLVRNAAEAISNDGFVVLTTGRLERDRELATDDRIDAPLPPGEYVFLTVDDTGRGIDLDDVDRIFDPFFTTKSNGRGLGLAASQGIVRGHGGSLQVSTTPGRGSTFRVLLPVAVSESRPSSGSLARRAERETDPGTATALVVDDESEVRLVAAEYLRHLGFQTIEAADGTTAVEIFEREHAALALVLLDMAMPGRDGLQVLHRLREIDAGVPVVLASGFREEVARERFAAEAPDGYIEKPFRLEALDLLVRDILESRDLPREPPS